MVLPYKEGTGSRSPTHVSANWSQRVGAFMCMCVCADVSFFSLKSHQMLKNLDDHEDHGAMLSIL